MDFMKTLVLTYINVY